MWNGKNKAQRRYRGNYKPGRQKLLENETVIDKWAPALLLMELDSLLWKDADSLQIKKLWEYLCTYCYLPRLSDYSVLEKTIQEGVQGEDYFCLCSWRK